jgi:hypothetical protein
MCNPDRWLAACEDESEAEYRRVQREDEALEREREAERLREEAMTEEEFDAELAAVFARVRGKP